MVEHRALYQNVTDTDFEAIKSDLTAEHFEVTSTGVDSFTAILAHGLIGIKGVYNRNQQTLQLEIGGNEWFFADLHHPGLEKKFLEKNLDRVAKKDNVDGDIQPSPVATPMDPKTGLVDTAKLQAETEAHQQKLQEENDKKPTVPVSKEGHEPTKSVTVVPDTVTGKVIDAKHPDKPEKPDLKPDDKPDLKPEPTPHKK